MSNREVSIQAQVLITVEEAAARLSIGRTQAYALVMHGELQSVKIGRTRRVLVASLSEYIRRLLGEDQAAQSTGRWADMNGTGSNAPTTVVHEGVPNGRQTGQRGRHDPQAQRRPLAGHHHDRGGQAQVFLRQDPG